MSTLQLKRASPKLSLQQGLPRWLFLVKSQLGILIVQGLLSVKDSGSQSGSPTLGALELRNGLWVPQ